MQVRWREIRRFNVRSVARPWLKYSTRTDTSRPHMRSIGAGRPDSSAIGSCANSGCASMCTSSSTSAHSSHCRSVALTLDPALRSAVVMHRVQASSLCSRGAGWAIVAACGTVRLRGCEVAADCGAPCHAASMRTNRFSTNSSSSCLYTLHHCLRDRIHALSRRECVKDGCEHPCSVQLARPVPLLLKHAGMS
jgi:hypothetical protein